MGRVRIQATTLQLQKCRGRESHYVFLLVFWFVLVIWLFALKKTKCKQNLTSSLWWNLFSHHSYKICKMHSFNKKIIQETLQKKDERSFRPG